MRSQQEEATLGEVYGILTGRSNSQGDRHPTKGDEATSSGVSETTRRDGCSEALGREALLKEGASGKLIEACPPTQLHLIGEAESAEARRDRARQLLEVLRRHDRGAERGGLAARSTERDPEGLFRSGAYEEYREDRLGEVHDILRGW